MLIINNHSPIVATIEPRVAELVSIPNIKVPYPTVHPNDYYPIPIIKPSLDNGPWIAGGAVLRWFQNRPVGYSDIDVFCANEEQLKMVQHRITVDYKDQSLLRYTSDNALTYEIWVRDTHDVEHWWTVQLIKKQYFDSADAVLNRFDITVCQFITDGSSIRTGATSIQDLNQKKLRFNKIKSDSLKRYIKYMAYGFRPDPGVFDEIINQTDAQWKYNPVEVAYDGF